MANLAAAAGYQLPQSNENERLEDAGMDLVKEIVPMVVGGDPCVDLFDLGFGGFNLIDGLTGDQDPEQAIDGLHDVVGAGLGLLAPTGGLAFLLGDVLGPAVFGSDDELNGAHVEDIGIDGRFHATSGKKQMDKLIHLFNGGDYSLTGTAGYEEVDGEMTKVRNTRADLSSRYKSTDLF